MRIYIVIVGISLAALAAIVLAASKTLSHFLGSANFWEAMTVEAISFIVTTAVIGSLSAAVLRWIDRSKSKPLRIHAANRIDDLLDSFLNVYKLILFRAGHRTRKYNSCVAFGQAPLKKYRSYNTGGDFPVICMVAKGIAEKIISTLDQFYLHIPIDQQADANKVLSFLNSRIELLDFAIRTANAGSNLADDHLSLMSIRRMKSEQNDRGADWVVLFDNLQRIFDSKSLKATDAFGDIFGYGGLLVNDVDKIVILLHQGNRNSADSGGEYPSWKSKDVADEAAQICGVYVDVNEKISDLDAQLWARIPSSVVGFTELETWDSVLRSGSMETLLQLEEHSSEFVAPSAMDGLKRRIAEMIDESS